MSQLGLGVMINMLCGSHGRIEKLKASIGKKIKKVWLGNNRLNFLFNDDTSFYIFDDGQTCCEHRYMHTDDDLDYYKNTKLIDIEIADVQQKEDDYTIVESQFMKVKTGKGVFTVVNYNEHNGYYGGFWIKIV